MAVVDMITLMIAGFAALVGIAIVASFLDRTRRATRREIARERRRRWEERQLQVGAFDRRWDPDED